MRPVEGAPGRRRHILVVEDDQAIRDMITELLNDAGYGVTQAGTGREALDRLREAEPDLIVLDLMLPELSGWQFLERTRAQAKDFDIPVLIVSAIEGKSDYPSTLGVAGWLTKPVDFDRFLRSVESLAGSPWAGTPSKRRVLIVEDEDPIGLLLREELIEEGFTVDLVSSLVQARQRIQVSPPDLILLDLMLPIEDGWTFLRARQGNAVLKAIPVVAMSAAPQARLVEAQQLGANAFVSKPFELEALTTVLRSFVG